LLFRYLKRELWYYIVSPIDLTLSNEVWFPLISIKGESCLQLLYTISKLRAAGSIDQAVYQNLDSIMLCVQYDLCAIYIVHILVHFLWCLTFTLF
jgi:hypothetical protein